jgi:ubiquinone/menaquinone biosynthesis C-methylase UbiE
MQESDVKEKYNLENRDDYEYSRWFSGSISKAGYKMTEKSIYRHVLDKDIKIENYLELGPGPGTWTKLFCKKGNISLDLVDISREMLASAKKNLSDCGNVTFFEKNFIDFQPDKKYDFFFSSRAAEYFPDKDVFVRKISEVLSDNSKGFIITKTPKYRLNKLLGRKTSEFHSGQVSAKELSMIFKKNNFKIEGIYPVTFSFPIFKSAMLNMLLFKIFSQFRLNFLSNFFSESYSINFSKK